MGLVAVLGVDLLRQPGRVVVFAASLPGQWLFGVGLLCRSLCRVNLADLPGQWLFGVDLHWRSWCRVNLLVSGLCDAGIAPTAMWY
jgi:hypothetical protein